MYSGQDPKCFERLCYNKETSLKQNTKHNVRIRPEDIEVLMYILIYWNPRLPFNTVYKDLSCFHQNTKILYWGNVLWCTAGSTRCQLLLVQQAAELKNMENERGWDNNTAQVEQRNSSALFGMYLDSVTMINVNQSAWTKQCVLSDSRKLQLHRLHIKPLLQEQVILCPPARINGRGGLFSFVHYSKAFKPGTIFWVSKLNIRQSVQIIPAIVWVVLQVAKLLHFLHKDLYML